MISFVLDDDDDDDDGQNISIDSYHMMLEHSINTFLRVVVSVLVVAVVVVVVVVVAIDREIIH